MRCPPPVVQPTYFPWVKEGAPPPRLIQENLGRHSLLQWREGKVYVSFIRTDESPKEVFGGVEEFPTTEVRGEQGHLVWVGDPGMGELVLVWQERTPHACDTHRLHLFDGDMSRERAEAEIKKIAESLRAN